MLYGFWVVEDFAIGRFLLRLGVLHLFIYFDLAQDYVVVVRVPQKDIAVGLHQGLEGLLTRLLWEAGRRMTQLVGFTLFRSLTDLVLVHVELDLLRQIFVLFALDADVVDFVLTLALLTRLLRVSRL